MQLVPVGGELFAVDGVDEGPGFVVAAKLREQRLAQAHILIHLKHKGCHSQN